MFVIVLIKVHASNPPLFELSLNLRIVAQLTPLSCSIRVVKIHRTVILTAVIFQILFALGKAIGAVPLQPTPLLLCLVALSEFLDMHMHDYHSEAGLANTMIMFIAVSAGGHSCAFSGQQRPRR
jgi:hypothetical protein